MHPGWNESYAKDQIGADGADPVFIHHRAEPFVEVCHADGSILSALVPVRWVARWLAQHRPELFFREIQNATALNERIKPLGFVVQCVHCAQADERSQP